MRYVPQEMERIWRSGDYTGHNAPMRRVTVQQPRMRLDTYGLQSTFRRVILDPTATPSFNPYPSGIDPTKGEPITNIYADYIFTAPKAPMEMPNVKSISWTRSIDQDVAECTVEFWNTSPLPLGTIPSEFGDLDQPGFYTAGRGTAFFSQRWKHEVNPWSKMLMPDNIIRTYEGYGTDTKIGGMIGEDGYVPPEKDSKLVQTGVWMIDEIKLNAVGMLVATCRDLGRLLMDHQSFLPVVPEDFYPVSFRDWSDKVTVQSQRTVTTQAVEPMNTRAVGSGNDRWPESSFLGASVHGHTHSHATDGNPGTYWLSIGNRSPGLRSAYEYIDLQVDNITLSQLRFWTVGAGYNVYISVQQGGHWVRDRGPVVPYRRDGIGAYDEGIPMVASVGGLGGEGEHIVGFPAIPSVNLVRVWFNNLQNFGLAGQKYRVGVREIRAYGPVSRTNIVTDSNAVALKPGPAGSNPGRCDDYTDIIKLFCAWAGLYWPSNAYQLHSDGEKVVIDPERFDTAVLGGGVRGRVWGDFQATGAAPPEEITTANFDKKTLMDGVGYIRDIIGFLFLLDESGGVQWRLPNVWTLGNWALMGYERPGRTTQMLTIDERQVLMGLEATLSSRSVREGIYVANATGSYAALAEGYNPNDTGLRRVGGWTDQNFASIREAKVMADLIAVRALFQYRRDVVEIPALPSIQIDDQVRIFERVTSEGFVHYVMGISSTNDALSGQWTYSLQTHWLGDDPDDAAAWVFDKTDLSPETIRYVDTLINGGTQWFQGKGLRAANTSGQSSIGDIRTTVEMGI